MANEDQARKLEGFEELKARFMKSSSFLEMTKQRYIEGEEKGRLEGREEGRLAGELDGSRAVLLRLLTRRFGELILRMAAEMIRGANSRRIEQGRPQQGWSIYGQARAGRKRLEPALILGQRRAWKTFLRAHWEGLAAMDFFSVEARTPFGLIRYFVLFVIGVGSRSAVFGIRQRRGCGRWPAI